MTKMSEYEKAFTGCDVAGIYAENLDYRYNRRLREHLHTPICWDSDSEEEQEEKETGAMHDACTGTDSPTNVQSSSTDECHAGNATTEAGDETRIKILNDDGEINRCSGKMVDQQASPSTVRSSKKLKNNHVVSSKVKAAKPHSISSPTPSRVRSGKSLPQQGRQSAEPPFVAYGCRDEQRDMGMKQTHNIRASANVHSSALKAMNRHTVEAKMRQERKAKRRTPKVIKMDATTESSNWLSEYQLRYPAYDTKVYVQHLPNRRHKLLI